MAKPTFKPYEGEDDYIFVSYAHKDDEKVYSLIQQLHDKGYRIWYDVGIKPGEEWTETIQNHLEKASLVLTFLSPNAIERKNVRREFVFAQENELSMITVFLSKTDTSKYGLKLRLVLDQYMNYYEYSDVNLFFDALLANKSLFTDKLMYSKNEPTIIAPTAPAINERGNTVGNIVNLGLVAQQNDWLYYCNVSDNGKLYKIHTDGTGKTKLNDDKIYCINVVGDWVYYYNVSDNNKLYKIHTDGTGKTKLNDDNSVFINIVGDWVYYRNVSDDDKLYKIRTDGTGKTKLNDDNSVFINVIGDWVYYCNCSDNDKLYKIRTDGTGKTKLNDDKIYCINVVGDWVYYRNVSDNDKLYKIRTDGTDKTKLNDDNSYYINIIGDWVYYCNYSDKYKLYKIRTDGTDKTKLNDDKIYCINVVGDWVYYYNYSYKYKLYKIRTDGTQRQIVN